MLQNGPLHSRLSALNTRPTVLQGPVLLHQLVRLASDSPAIDFLQDGSKRRTLCYKTLHKLSDMLAARITRISAQSECASSIIPVLLPQSPELYITLLAILKAGKAFCPLNLDTPAERLSFILNDVSADMLITASVLEIKTHATAGVQVLLADRELLEDGHQPNLHLPQMHHDSLAYVLYTSGSTGLPKAVTMSHQAVTQSLLAHDRHLPHFNRFLQFAAPTFDVSIFEIFFPWFRGRTLVGCTRTHMLDDLPRAIRDLEVDAAEFTPTVVSSLLRGRSSVPSLKLLLTIGEMLTSHIVEEYGGNETKESMLWACYGPTEAAIHCTLQPQLSTSSSTSMIGTPLDTVSTFIAAPYIEGTTLADLRILPAGHEGELVLGGVQIANEYLNRSELTAASFIDHPDYGRLYRTGDRARLLENGKLECLGRIADGQIKLRGQRVELGEIENVIRKTGACHSVIVMVVENSLVAVCASNHSRVSSEYILETCRRWLPGFMVPSDVFWISSLPQLPSGKVDKKALRSTYLHTLHGRDSSLPRPTSRVGEIVSRITAQYTRPNPGLGSSLASVGLDSLQAIRIASALRQEGYHMGAMDILTAKDLGDLIEICKSRIISKSVKDISDILESSSIDVEDPHFEQWRADVAHIMPCTPLQEAMLVETTIRPSAYCNWIEVALPIPCSLNHIRYSIRTLAQSNEILRTGFYSMSQKKNVFAQIVWKTLAPFQVQEVVSFSRLYSLGSVESLLRPLTVQVKNHLGKMHLLFQIHHALYDGWSFDLMLQDLDRLVHGSHTAQRPQFRNIVKHYINEQQSNKHNLAKEYWTRLLADYVPVPLPNYHGRIVETAGVRVVSGHSAVSAKLLFASSDLLAVSPQVFFQAATAYVLSLYMGSTDVVLGNVTSGRTIPVTGIEDILGPCITTLPFRLDFQGLSQGLEVLRMVQDLNREGLQHSALPLREIARATNVRPGTRLFDVLFVWQQSLSEVNESSDVARIIDSADDLEYKITLEFEPRKNSVCFRATFDPSTIPEAQVRSFAQQIDEVVQVFLKDPSCMMADFNSFFTAKSCSIANPNPRRATNDHNPSYAVERWATESPEKIAVVFGHLVNGYMEIKDSITYGALNSRANQLARALSAFGLGQDQLVGVMMEKSVTLYITILAISKLGLGYLPITPDMPLDRIRRIMDDAKVTICASESTVSTSLKQQLPTTIIDIDCLDISCYSDQALILPYNGSHLAYAVFTSGSTGKPKGVLVTQENLMSNLEYLSTIYPYSSGSRLLQACSQAFDVSVFEIFFSWHVGICLCTAQKDDLFRNLEAAINHLEVTHLSLTPTVAALINPKNVPRVQFLVTAGEALTERVRREWAGRGLCQGYGPSETTNICTIKMSVTTSDLINNIGPPFSNTSAFVLDPHTSHILPRGAIGELCFGGTQVFRGYLNSPELNSTKIIHHPVYGRIYRSGDMGLLLPDDSILFTGRLDDQVKIRGNRVELGEINSIILDHHGVRDCATLLISSPEGTSSLATFWVPVAHTVNPVQLLGFERFRPVTMELSTSLTRRLPSYMVPSHLIPISRIPMTTQAKIDARLLRNLFSSVSKEALAHSMGSQDADSIGNPLSEWEMKVSQVLAQTLGLQSSDIRRTYSFFALGLDSLSAISFCNSLKSANLGNFTVSMVLKNPSLAHLSAITETDPSPPKSSTTDLSHVFLVDQVSHIRSRYQKKDLKVAKILPCTPLQEAMLSSTPSFSGPAYCNLLVFNIRGDVSRLQECWTLMIRRHDILRTSFIQTEDPSYAFAQVVLEDYMVPWQQLDLQNDIQSQTNTIIMSLLEDNKPPVYLASYQARESTKLLFCCHHALYDGIAIGTLLQEIETSYLGAELSTPIPYDSFLEAMLSQDFAKADEYWDKRFQDYSPTAFPSSNVQASGSEHSTSCVSRRLSMPLSEVRQASKGLSTTLLSVVQATWAKLLHFYTGESDICFGNVVNGRTLPGVDLGRLVAPCFNTLPVRVDFDFYETNSTLIEYIHARNIESLVFQLTPLRRIQNRILEDGSRLFDTLIILQNSTLSLDDSIWTLELDIGEMDLPIVCEIIQDEINDTFNLNLHYATALLSDGSATIVAETFDHIFSTSIQFPQAPANDTMALPRHLRAESNIDFQPFDTGSRLLHSGFEMIASAQSDMIALDFLHADGLRTVWSFMELNQRANDIAHRLIEHGIGAEDIIPIHMPKGPLFYASVLGILKSGAAFAPVHPDLPEARKTFMFTELRANIILCAQGHHIRAGCSNAQIIQVEDIESSAKSDPITVTTPSNLAYCLFTSGSTGLPVAGEGS